MLPQSKRLHTLGAAWWLLRQMSGAPLIEGSSRPQCRGPMHWLGWAMLTMLSPLDTEPKHSSYVQKHCTCRAQSGTHESCYVKAEQQRAASVDRRPVTLSFLMVILRAAGCRLAAATGLLPPPRLPRSALLPPRPDMLTGTASTLPVPLPTFCPPPP